MKKLKLNLSVGRRPGAPKKDSCASDALRGKSSRDTAASKRK
ncbi:MAG TPA: hypothetical protein VIE39_04320 [Thermoanaerobaculia bacterium]|jgi:hypothetical protein